MRCRRWFERENVDRAAERVRADQRRRRNSVDELHALQRRRVEEREIEVARIPVVDAMAVDVDHRFGGVGSAQSKRYGRVAAAAERENRRGGEFVPHHIGNRRHAGRRRILRAERHGRGGRRRNRFAALAQGLSDHRERTRRRALQHERERGAVSLERYRSMRDRGIARRRRTLGRFRRVSPGEHEVSAGIAGRARGCVRGNDFDARAGDGRAVAGGDRTGNPHIGRLRRGGQPRNERENSKTKKRSARHAGRAPKKVRHS